MAQSRFIQVLSKLLLAVLLLSSLQYAFASGPNNGHGVLSDNLRPRSASNVGESVVNFEGRRQLVAPRGKVGGRKLLQGALGCNGEVGICATQASNSDFTSGDFLGSGGGFGAGSGISGSGDGRRGGRRGGRGGRGRGRGRN